MSAGKTDGSTTSHFPRAGEQTVPTLVSGYPELRSVAALALSARRNSAEQAPGAIGAFGANHHLRQPLVFLNMPVMQQPEAYVGNVEALLEDGVLTNEGTRDFLKGFADAFADWIEKTKRA